MSSFDQSILAEIRARIDLIDLVEEYGVELRRVGNSAKACCPFHTEKTPSFTVNSDRGRYKCFGCGEAGDAFTFVMKFEGIPFAESVRKLAQRTGVKLIERYDPQAKARARLYQINQEVAAFYRRCLLQTKEAAEARAYLASRSLDGEVAERFGIGYAPERRHVLLDWAKHHGFAPEELVAAGLMAPPRTPGDDYYDRFHGRITFPICDPQGRVIAFSCRLLRPSKHTGKYVNSPETEIFKKANTLYAYHLARPNITKAVPRRALVCEGQVDVIRCHACGFSVAVASQGTSFTVDHVAMLKRCADTADLVFDGDKAGVKAAVRTMGLFLAAGMPVRIVSLPEGEDPDSLLLKQGAEAFRDCLQAAEDPAPYLIRRLREQESAPDSMEAIVRMAKAAVATVLDCPEPVLVARFLQDAARALKVPVETLQHDLEALRENAAAAEERRQAFQARQAQLPEAERPEAPAALDEPAEELLVDEAEFVPVDDFGETPPANEALPAGEGEVEAPPAAPSMGELVASQNLAGALCELLAHHFAEPEVMDCLIRHLPPAFVHHPYAAKFYDLAVSAALSGAAVLTPPADDPAFSDYLVRLFAAPDRIAADGEFTPLAYARDLVRCYWMREYDRRARLLSPDTPEALTLLLSKKRLQTLPWEQAEPFLDATHVQLAALEPPKAGPDRPSTRPFSPLDQGLPQSVAGPASSHPGAGGVNAPALPEAEAALREAFAAPALEALPPEEPRDWCPDLEPSETAFYDTL